MGDEHDGGIDLVFQIPQQIQDLCLNGHVQSRSGLVSDDQLGVAGQGHGDHDTLAHTAGQLVGEHIVHALAVGDTGHLQQVDGALLDLLLALALAVVEGNDLVQLSADAEHRVQAGHGLLKDHGHIVAPQILHPLRGGLGDIVALAVAEVQTNFAVHDLALRPLQQLHDGEAGNGLTAAGLAHHAHGLADGDVEGDAVHSADGTHIREEVGMQILDLQCVVGILHLSQILGLRHILALMALFQLICDAAVLTGDAPGFLSGQIAGLILLRHTGSSFLSASSSGRTHPADRRRPG